VNKKALLINLLVAILIPTAFVAAETTLVGMTMYFAGQVVLIATWIIVIMWVVTGVLFLTAQGDPGKLNAGKTALLSSVAGTILVIIANGATRLIANSFDLSIEVK